MKTGNAVRSLLSKRFSAWGDIGLALAKEHLS
jgi:hypothetical protein